MKKQDLFHCAGTTVALMVGATMVSKVFGMLRQMMTASIFAASMEGIAFQQLRVFRSQSLICCSPRRFWGPFCPFTRGIWIPTASVPNRFLLRF